MTIENCLVIIKLIKLLLNNTMKHIERDKKNITDYGLSKFCECDFSVLSVLCKF